MRTDRRARCANGSPRSGGTAIRALVLGVPVVLLALTVMAQGAIAATGEAPSTGVVGPAPPAIGTDGHARTARAIQADDPAASVFARLGATAGPGSRVRLVPQSSSDDPTTTPTAEPYTEVLITDNGLEPPIVAVTAGSLVRWTNDTLEPHNTTHLPDLGQPVLWDSGDIAPEGGQYEHRFKEVGSFRYFDALRPERERYVGTIVVTSNDPTATPLTPTSGPTPTNRPATQEPSPTPTLPATPTPVPPTKTPVELIGWLYRHSEPGCDEVDAVLVDCTDPDKRTLVRTGGVVDDRLFGWEARLNGVMETCGGGTAEYLWLSSAAPAPGVCQQPTSTPTTRPPPTPTAPFSDESNLALHKPVTAKSPTLPGFEPALATDGDTGSVWYHADPEAWIYVDLGETKAFNQIRLRWAYPFAERYGIYVWEEGAWRGKFLADNNSGGDDVRNLAVTRARYVLIYLMRSSLAAGFSLAEIEVYGDEQPNWGMGQPVAVSSELQGYEGRNATDGRPGTWWLSQYGDPNPWIVVYLPQAISIREFILYWTTEFPRSYSLALFEDGRLTFYTPEIRHASGGPVPVRGQILVRADTVMVYTYENDPGGRIGLGEIEIYGPGPGVFVSDPGGGEPPVGDAIRVPFVDARMSWGSPAGPAAPIVSDPQELADLSVGASGEVTRRLVDPRRRAPNRTLPPLPADVPTP